MDQIILFMKLGWWHIIDLKAIDHQLFILALVTGFYFKQLPKILILATAFTLGHSITLALSALNLVNFPSKWAEVLIAVTILVTAFENIFIAMDRLKSPIQFKYGSAFAFGLIHGLGFAHSLGTILGKQSDLTLPLIGFNIGLEIGQILVITVYLIATYWVPKKFRKGMEVSISALLIIPSFWMILERLLAIP